MSKGKKKMEIYGSDIRGESSMKGVLERVEASYMCGSLCFTYITIPLYVWIVMLYLYIDPTICVDRYAGIPGYTALHIAVHIAEPASDAL
jgi:hypothetical protein